MYKWDTQWSRFTSVLSLLSIVYVIGPGELVGAVPSLSAATDWSLLGFIGVFVALVLNFVDSHFVTKSFRNKWFLLHSGEGDPRTFQIDEKKLDAGAGAWREFTHGGSVESSVVQLAAGSFHFYSPLTYRDLQGGESSPRRD